MVAVWSLLGGDPDIWNFALTSDKKLHWRVLYALGISGEKTWMQDLLQEGLTNFVNSVCNQDRTHPISDPAAIHDYNRLLRNFNGYGLRNHKYPDKPLIWLHKGRKKAYAGDILKLLYDYGYLKKPKCKKPWKELTDREKWYDRNRERGWHSLSSTTERIKLELRANYGLIKCTRKELAERLGRHVNSINLCLNILKKRKEVDWEQVGNNKAGNKRRCQIWLTRMPVNFSDTHQMSIKNKTNAPPILKEINKIKQTSVLREFRGKAVAKGLRNKFTFAASMELKYLAGGNIEENQVYVFVRKHYDYEELRSFTERETRNVIKNALKPQFKFPLSEKKLSEWGLLPEKISHPASEPRGYLN